MPGARLGAGVLYAVKAHGPVEALEEVFAYIDETEFPGQIVLLVRNEVVCHVRAENLAACRESTDSGGAVDTHAKLALTHRLRGAGVDADADFSGPFLSLQRESCLLSGLDSFSGGRKSRED